MDLPKILLTGLVFLFFLFFLVFFEFLDNWAWESKKTSRKTKKKKKKAILHGLTQDSSHRIVFFCFFWFSLSFWTFGKLRMEKKGKNKTCKNPTLPAWVSVFFSIKYTNILIITIIYFFKIILDLAFHFNT